jgi:PAS domain S-box-containing protein
MRLSTRLTIVMVALVLASVAAVGLVTYRNVEAAILAAETERVQSHVRLLVTELETRVRNARADAIAFRSAVALAGIVRANLAGGIDPVDGATEAQWRERFASRFVAELAAKPDYLQFRVIGAADGGREVVRVERTAKDDTVRVVPQAELQRRGDEPYFQDAIKLAPSEVHVSPIELNRQHGAIEVPHVPVIRVATAVHGPDGRPFGIVVINVDLRPAFSRIRSAAGVGRQIYVVNGRGDYLVHPDAGREFAFEFGAPYRWQAEFPELANRLGGAEGGVHLINDQAGQRLGAAMALVRLLEGQRIAVIETVPYALLVAPAVAVRDFTLLVGLLAVLAALAIAIVLARSLTQPLVQMTGAVEAFSRGDRADAPIGASGEIGVLARAFERMAADVQDKNRALMRETNERRRLFETTLDLILIVDRKGKLLQVSPSCTAILGYWPEEMIGSSAALFLYPDDLNSTRDEMRAARKGRDTRNFDCRYVHKDGRVVPLAWTGVWSEPEQRHFFIGRDMTERIRLEAQLRQSQKMDAIGQLTGGVAHDFNNMLTVITGTIDILAGAVAHDPKLAAIARMIDQAASRGAELTQHLLAFARKQPLQPRETDLNALIVDTARLLRPALGEQIEIESMLENDAWPALVDPGQLANAILNLAVNARDAMPEGGKLTLETANVVLDEAYAKANSDAAPGRYVMIAVSDTGSGIPAAIRDKVFEPFFTTKDVGKGTGLGLSMVYGLVKQSGGHIKIYSEEGHGTTIKLYLPRADEKSDWLREALPSVALEGGSETILVVEDEALVRNYVVTQLESLGYKTITTANAAEALSHVRQRLPFDLLFTDVILPGTINGRQLADEVRALRPDLKVLYTSGYTENAIVHHGRLDAGVLLLTKPYRKADLARMVRLALAVPATMPAESAAPLRGIA